MRPQPSPGPLPRPRPASVRYNDWRAIALPESGAFKPVRPVSVIVPCFAAPGALALTLAGLERQDWPRELLEVVVVDDGSEPPLVRPAATALDLRVIRQARRGFGLARARNAGVRAATHDILMFLDGDVIPEAGLIAAHARWHHAVGDALTVGFCAYVSADGIDTEAVRGHRGSLAQLFAGRPFDPPWLERHMARTGDLTSRHPDLFRAVTGHNFAISRALFEESGGFDESFTRYGGEDTELAYRVQVRGGLLVPVRTAFGWHQGRWSEGREQKERDLDRQAAKLADLIAEPGFRPASSGRRFTVPRHVVTLDAAREPADRAVQAAETLLADPAGDLALCIEIPVEQHLSRARVEQRFGQHPRVRLATTTSVLDAFPASPIHIRLAAGAVLRSGPAAGPGLVARLAAALGDAATASADLDGARVWIARAWALNRARRAGGRAADYGDARTVPYRVLLGTSRWVGPFRWRTAAGGPAGGVRPHRSLWAVLARVWAEARHVRGVRTGWRFVRWLAAAARWRLREGRGRSTKSLPVDCSPTSGAAPADPPLGAVIAAFGSRSRAVFAASSHIVHAPCGPDPPEHPSIDVTVADTPEAAVGVRSPVALLSNAPALAVPAFDPALDNPVGWVRDVEPRVLALGPPGRLPPGARARRAAAPEDRGALLHCHHVEDIAAFHAGPACRAGTLARIAARGVPVRLADRDPALPALLGAELHELMTDRIRDADAAEREALSIAMRRIALRTHSLRARARQVCEAAGVAPPLLPEVSVLLATHRPTLLAHAVANVARQRYPRLELVLALHGMGFEPHALETALSGFAPPTRVLRLDANRPLGVVLDAAAAAASGALLAKMDDDDVYGPEHVWDLVLAHEYSGAALVGKFPSTVYLARLDRTVRQRTVMTETWSSSITGGTMLLRRADLERAGGWRPLPREVDAALIEDVLRTGGGVYRTHGAGYVLVRHDHHHTWPRRDAEFLAAAEAIHPGWRPGLAGIGDLPPPRRPG